MPLNRKPAALCLLLVIGFSDAETPVTDDQLATKRLSTSALDDAGAWQPVPFDGKQETLYEVVEMGGESVIQATTNASASGLVYPLSINVDDFPVISWQWKVSNIYQTGDGNTKQGDDFPARLYVTFKFIPEQHSWLERVQHNAAELLYGDELPGMTLNYIWANKLPIGTIIPNPYASQAMMIAVASGPPEADQWTLHQRSITEDFKQAFGSNPPPVTGIGIMSDSDNTGEQAQAWYKHITLLADD